MDDPLGERQIAAWIHWHLTQPEDEHDRMLRFMSWRMPLYFEAVRMQEEGKKFQYRKFGVGVAALAFDPDKSIWDGQVKIVTGYNSKDEARGIPRKCAEARMFEAALEGGYKRIDGMIVVAEYQPDDVSGHQCTTLHPCHSCRKMMLEHSLAWPGMPIVTALPPPSDIVTWSHEKIDQWRPVWEWHTLEEILQIHKTT